MNTTDAAFDRAWRRYQLARARLHAAQLRAERAVEVMSAAVGAQLEGFDLPSYHDLEATQADDARLWDEGA